MAGAIPQIHQLRNQVGFASLTDGCSQSANPSAPVEEKLAGDG